MMIVPFAKANTQYAAEAAQLLVECFPHSYFDRADDEVTQILTEEKLSFMAIEDGHLIGFVGARPQYGVTGWELHPLAVRGDCRGRGVGTGLVAALEKAAAQKGCITMYLGTDDEFGKTSLSDTDLYVDTYAKIESIKNLHQHPFEFYQKAGYKIVGVLPDANRIGKPDIYMAKRLVRTG